MRRPVLGWVLALSVLTLAPAGNAWAQGPGILSDPFSFYYGYYLPHQAAQAAQPRAIDPINQVVANRQYTAQTDRSQLYDPISPYGDEDADMFSPYGGGGGGRRGGMTSPSGARSGQGVGYGYTASNIAGNGPSLYYNRSARYFPSLKPGRGPNRNLAPMRGRAGAGMPSMPSMPSMGGPY